MGSYVFTLSIVKFNAFEFYMRAQLPDLYQGFSSSENTFTFYTTNVLSAEEEARYASIVNAYVDPSYWLEFNHTDNHFLKTNKVNSTSNTVISTFIVSPYADAQNGTVMGSMKTVVGYTTSDITHFLGWDGESPMTLTLELYDYSQGQVIQTLVQDVADVATAWRSRARLGESGSAQIWRSLQIYGLKDANPGSDCIWQFRAKVSNPLLDASLDGLQRLYYILQ